MVVLIVPYEVFIVGRKRTKAGITNFVSEDIFFPRCFPLYLDMYSQRRFFNRLPPTSVDGYIISQVPFRFSCSRSFSAPGGQRCATSRDDRPQEHGEEKVVPEPRAEPACHLSSGAQGHVQVKVIYNFTANDST